MGASEEGVEGNDHCSAADPRKRSVMIGGSVFLSCGLRSSLDSPTSVGGGQPDWLQNACARVSSVAALKRCN